MKLPHILMSLKLSKLQNENNIINKS